MERLRHQPTGRVEARYENRIIAGQQLKALRGDIPLRAMAKVLNVDPGFLSRVENGRTPIPSKIIQGYVGHTSLDETKYFELELLCGRAPGVDSDLAHILALSLQYRRKLKARESSAKMI